jgi:hypothetical protein
VGLEGGQVDLNNLTQSCNLCICLVKTVHTWSYLQPSSAVRWALNASDAEAMPLRPVLFR